MRMEGKVAVVTGGGSGIGRATASALASEGARIAVWDVSGSGAAAVADHLKHNSSDALAVQCDIANRVDVERAAAITVEKLGPIEILANCAGITLPAMFLDTSDEILDRQLNVNLRGTWICCQVVGKQMASNGGGKIVNVASLLAHVGSPNLGAYAASKGGILSFSRVAAVELAPYNVTVNVVSPGQTRTPINDPLQESAPDITRDRSRKIPAGRINEAEDVARAIVFLASSEADMITGHALPVDGGALALHSAYVWDWEEEAASRRP